MNIHKNMDKTTLQTLREDFEKEFGHWDMYVTTKRGLQVEANTEILWQFIEQAYTAGVQEGISEGRAKPKRAFCIVCNCFIDSDSGERKTK